MLLCLGFSRSRIWPSVIVGVMLCSKGKDVIFVLFLVTGARVYGRSYEEGGFCGS